MSHIINVSSLMVGWLGLVAVLFVIALTANSITTWVALAIGAVMPPLTLRFIGERSSRSMTEIIRRTENGEN